MYTNNTFVLSTQNGGEKNMDKIAKIILFICKEYDVNLKSDSKGNISLVREGKEFCINNISDIYQVKIFKESQPNGADYNFIEQV